MSGLGSAARGCGSAHRDHRRPAAAATTNVATAAMTASPIRTSRRRSTGTKPGRLPMVATREAHVGRFPAPAKDDVGRFPSPAKDGVGRFPAPAKDDVGRFPAPAKDDVGRFPTPGKDDVGPSWPELAASTPGIRPAACRAIFGAGRSRRRTVEAMPPQMAAFVSDARTRPSGSAERSRVGVRAEARNVGKSCRDAMDPVVRTPGAAPAVAADGSVPASASRSDAASGSVKGRNTGTGRAAAAKSAAACRASPRRLGSASSSLRANSTKAARSGSTSSSPASGH